MNSPRFYSEDNASGSVNESDKKVADSDAGWCFPGKKFTILMPIEGRNYLKWPINHNIT